MNTRGTVHSILGVTIALTISLMARITPATADQICSQSRVIGYAQDGNGKICDAIEFVNTCGQNIARLFCQMAWTGEVYCSSPEADVPPGASIGTSYPCGAWYIWECPAGDAACFAELQGLYQQYHYSTSLPLD